VNQRDELIEIIENHVDRLGSGARRYEVQEAADAILAAGYRKFPVATDLDALPLGTAILSPTGRIHEARHKPGSPVRWHGLDGADRPTSRLTEDHYLIIRERSNR
jgi:hypothetical protein